MFRTAELGRTLSKEDYHQAVPVLRAGLLDAQQELRAAPFPVIIVFGGVDKGGKIDTINLLNEWLDPRWLITRAYGPPSDEMVERPEYWRYWRDLPPKGRIGLFLSCWYSRPVLDRVHSRTTESMLDEALERIVAFERCLADDGALILKFWMHLGKKAQKERLTKLEANPLTRWRVSRTDWDHWQLYEKFIAAAERAIRRTSTGRASWQIIEGADKRYRSVVVGKAIVEAVRKRLDDVKLQRTMINELKARVSTQQQSSSAEVQPTVNDSPVTNVIELPRITTLSRLDMTKSLDKKT